MITFLIVLGVVIYIAGVIIDVRTKCEHNHEFHDGGFLGLGHTSYDTRDATPRDVRRALIWPLRGLYWFFRGAVGFLNDLASGFFLVFGVRYKDTAMYRKVDKWAWD